MGRRWLFDMRVQCGVCVLLAAGLFVLTGSAGLADAAKPAMSAKAKRGSALFQQNCVSCHNKKPDDTTPFGPPNLHGIFSAKPLVTSPITPEKATEVIRNGIAPMPAFGSMLSEAQIGDLIAYLKVQ